MISMLVLFLVACVALLALTFVLPPSQWSRLLGDTRGVLGTMANVALSDRGDGGACNMPRIPTGRFPAFSTTLRATLDANGEATMILEAERDLLLIGMSATIADAAPATAGISVTYCNTRYLVNSDRRQWTVCCDRKPVFLVGVRENKKLEIRVTGGTAAGAASVTLHGFQGNGCCG